MNDERCDRDRVTAILTLKDAATPLPWRHECSDMCANQIEADDDEQAVASTWAPISLPDNDYSREEKNAAYIVAACNAFPDVAAALLEAVDTIDRLEGELADEREKCPMRLIHYGPAEHEHQWVKRGVQGMGLDFLGEKCSVCGAVQALNGGNE